MEVKFCRDCKYSKPEEPNDWCNECFNPKVVSKNSWALSNNCKDKRCGVSCNDERRKNSIFAPCGMKGKLWEAVHNNVGEK